MASRPFEVRPPPAPCFRPSPSLGSFAYAPSPVRDVRPFQTYPMSPSTLNRADSRSKVNRPANPPSHARAGSAPTKPSAPSTPVTSTEKLSEKPIDQVDFSSIGAEPLPRKTPVLPLPPSRSRAVSSSRPFEIQPPRRLLSQDRKDSQSSIGSSASRQDSVSTLAEDKGVSKQPEDIEPRPRMGSSKGTETAASGTPVDTPEPSPAQDNSKPDPVPQSSEMLPSLTFMSPREPPIRTRQRSISTTDQPTFLQNAPQSQPSPSLARPRRASNSVSSGSPALPFIDEKTPCSPQSRQDSFFKQTMFSPISYDKRDQSSNNSPLLRSVSFSGKLEQKEFSTPAYPLPGDFAANKAKEPETGSVHALRESRRPSIPFQSPSIPFQSPRIPQQRDSDMFECQSRTGSISILLDVGQPHAFEVPAQTEYPPAPARSPPLLPNRAHVPLTVTSPQRKDSELSSYTSSMSMPSTPSDDGRWSPRSSGFQPQSSKSMADDQHQSLFFDIEPASPQTMRSSMVPSPLRCGFPIMLDDKPMDSYSEPGSPDEDAIALKPKAPANKRFSRLVGANVDFSNLSSSKDEVASPRLAPSIYEPSNAARSAESQSKRDTADFSEPPSPRQMMAKKRASSQPNSGAARNRFSSIVGGEIHFNLADLNDAQPRPRAASSVHEQNRYNRVIDFDEVSSLGSSPVGSPHFSEVSEPESGFSLQPVSSNESTQSYGPLAFANKPIKRKPLPPSAVVNIPAPEPSSRRPSTASLEHAHQRDSSPPRGNLDISIVPPKFERGFNPLCAHPVHFDGDPKDSKGQPVLPPLVTRNLDQYKNDDTPNTATATVTTATAASPATIHAPTPQSAFDSSRPSLEALGRGSLDTIVIPNVLQGPNIKRKNSGKASSSWSSRFARMGELATDGFNNIAQKVNQAGFLPDTLENECDKGAKIIRSFCNQGIIAKGGEKMEKPLTTARDDQGDKSIISIPPEIIKKAVGLAIFTTLRGGLSLNGGAGSGILVARLHDNTWSPPSAIHISHFGGGLSAGIDIFDCICVINTQEALEAFMETRVSLGAGVAFAYGPYGTGRGIEWATGKDKDAKDGRGRSGSVSSGDSDRPVIELNGEPLQIEDVKDDKPEPSKYEPVYFYVKSKGMFAGASYDGNIITERKEANARFYGEPMSAEGILRGYAEAPLECQQLENLREALRAAEHDGLKQAPEPPVVVVEEEEEPPMPASPGPRSRGNSLHPEEAMHIKPRSL